MVLDEEMNDEEMIPDNSDGRKCKRDGTSPPLVDAQQSPSVDAQPDPDAAEGAEGRRARTIRLGGSNPLARHENIEYRLSCPRLVKGFACDAFNRCNIVCASLIKSIQVWIFESVMSVIPV